MDLTNNNDPEFYANFETLEKNAKNLLTKNIYRENKRAKLEFGLFYTTNLQMFLANDFS